MPVHQVHIRDTILDEIRYFGKHSHQPIASHATVSGFYLRGTRICQNMRLMIGIPTLSKRRFGHKRSYEDLTPERLYAYNRAPVIFIY